MGARPAIPHKRGCRSVPRTVGPRGDFIYTNCNIYVNRNQIERLWGRLKEWRAVAIRYEPKARASEKTKAPFMCVQ